MYNNFKYGFHGKSGAYLQGGDERDRTPPEAKKWNKIIKKLYVDSSYQASPATTQGCQPQESIWKIK